MNHQLCLFLPISLTTEKQAAAVSLRVPNVILDESQPHRSMTANEMALSE